MPKMTSYLKRVTVVLLALFAASLVGALITAIPTQGQGTTGGNPSQTRGAAVRTRSTKGEAGGTDTNIKTARSANEKNSTSPVPAPQTKGGPKSRATACRFHVDNRTPYAIDIYTDGAYRGSVGPWDDVYGWVEYGASLYARADFDDGTYLFWRRGASKCPMTWTLLP